MFLLEWSDERVHFLSFFFFSDWGTGVHVIGTKGGMRYRWAMHIMHSLGTAGAAAGEGYGTPRFFPRYIDTMGMGMGILALGRRLSCGFPYAR